MGQKQGGLVRAVGAGVAARLRKAFDPRRLMAREIAYSGVFFPANAPQPDQGALTETELRNTFVFRCVDAKASAAASVPLLLRRRVAGGRIETVERPHRILALLDWINDASTPVTFWQQFFADLECEGNAFTWGARRGGEVTSLVRIKPEEITPQPDPDGRRQIGSYLWTTPRGTRHEFPAEEIWHARTRNPDTDMRGLGKLQRMRFEIRMEDQMNAWNWNRFATGFSPQLIVSFRGRFEEGDRERIEEMLRRKFTTPDGDQFVLVDADGEGNDQLTFKDLPRPKNDEVMFIESKKELRNTYIAGFGTPPTEVMDYSDAFRANAEEQPKGFWENSIANGIHKLALASLNSDFLPKFFPQEFAAGYFFEYDYSDVRALQQSAEEKARVAEMNVRGGMMSPNDGREFQGFDRVDDEVMDAYYMNGRPVGSDPLEGLLGAAAAADADADADADAEQSADAAGDDGGREEAAAPDGTVIAFRSIQARLDALRAKASHGGAYLDLDMERREFERLVRAKIERLLRKVIEAWLVENEADLFNFAAPTFLEFLATRVLLIREAVVDNTNESVRATIADAMAEGIHGKDLRDRIQDAFEVRRETWQLQRIARTEVHTTQQGGAFMAAEQNGVEWKEWITARDDRVRGLEVNDQTDHDAIERGGPIELSSLFRDPRSGAQMEFPGDTAHGAGPGDVINCRCDWIAVQGPSEKSGKRGGRSAVKALRGGTVDLVVYWTKREEFRAKETAQLARFVDQWIEGMQRRALAAFDAQEEAEAAANG